MQIKDSHGRKTLQLILISNDLDLIPFSLTCGVDRIFVDLEALGKQERQGHLDTRISGHDLRDVDRVRAVVGDRELLVRVNPMNENSGEEIDQVIRRGADSLMLPMFRRLDEVRGFIDQVKGRKRTIALIETPEAVALAPVLAELPELDELYIGLNDLHLGLGLDFMFEPLADGLVEKLARLFRRAGKPFGFGGIARIGEGQLDAALILAEHERLGSSAVILSRTFFRPSESLEPHERLADFKEAMQRLRDCEERLRQRTEEVREADHQKMVEQVSHLVDQIRASKKRLRP